MRELSIFSRTIFKIEIRIFIQHFALVLSVRHFATLIFIEFELQVKEIASSEGTHFPSSEAVQQSGQVGTTTIYIYKLFFIRRFCSL